eukprot:jgi/Galph1/1/GphlegSOOS_G8.1
MNDPNGLDRFWLDGKVCLVTGAARGIGKALAIALAQAGASAVGLIDIESEALSLTKKELSHAFPHMKISALPARHLECLHCFRNTRAIDSFASENNRLDSKPSFKCLFFSQYVIVACNNAGIIYSGTEEKYAAENASLEEWQRTIDVNLTGVFLCCQAEANWMLRNNYGKIINIASMSGKKFSSFTISIIFSIVFSAHIVNHPQKHAAYHASKAGVLQLTRSLGAEWADKGIHVNCISPGYVETYQTSRPGLQELKEYWKRLTPAKRLATVEDIQGPLIFLASDASSFVYGAEIIVDGGFTLW